MIKNEKSNSRVLGKVILSTLFDAYLVCKLTGIFIFGFNFSSLFSSLLYGSLTVLAIYFNYNTGVAVSRYIKEIASKSENNNLHEKKFVILIGAAFYLLLSIIVSIISMSILVNIYSSGKYEICDSDGCSPLKPDAFLAFLYSFLIMAFLNITTFIGLSKGYQKAAAEDRDKIELKDSTNFTVEPNNVEPEKNSGA